MAGKIRHPALTRIGENFNRRNFYRRDANCPAMMIYRLNPKKPFTQREVWVSNISESGVLLLVEGMNEPIEDIYVVLPGMRTKIRGKVRRQGDFTVAMEFEKLLQSDLVDRIAALEPLRGAKPGDAAEKKHSDAAEMRDMD